MFDFHNFLKNIFWNASSLFASAFESGIDVNPYISFATISEPYTLSFHLMLALDFPHNISSLLTVAHIAVILCCNSGLWSPVFLHLSP